jgi:hypothetical protein
METSQELQQLAEALAKAQAELSPVRSIVTTHFISRGMRAYQRL